MKTIRPQRGHCRMCDCFLAALRERQQPLTLLGYDWCTFRFPHVIATAHRRGYGGDRCRNVVPIPRRYCTHHAAPWVRKRRTRQLIAASRNND